MKHYEKRRSVSSKMFVMMLALVLVFGCAVGGTIAWLTATSATVENTFTYGDINIELTETKPIGQEAKIIPGVKIDKDPKVTVKAGSEACWLFVKVKETDWPEFKEADGTRKISYKIADGWTLVPGETDVYYCTINTMTTADTDYAILEDNKVTVSENLLKTEVSALATAGTQFKLTFTAYAVQKDGINDVATAWKTASTVPVV